MIALDFGFGPVEAQFWRWLFAMTRIGAAMLAAPIFGSGSVPMQVRVIAAGALAVLVCGWTPLAVPPALFSLEGVLAVAGEALVGLSMGFVLQLAFAAPTLAAEVIGGGMRRSLFSTRDPPSCGPFPALGRYFPGVLTLVFLATGGHLQWFALLVSSYESFPPGHAWLGAERMAEIAGFAGEMFATAVAIALPVTLIPFLVQVVTGVLSRSAPALNLFALGLPAGVLAGLAALIVSAPLLTDTMSEVSTQAIAMARAVITR